MALFACPLRISNFEALAEQEAGRGLPPDPVPCADDLPLLQKVALLQMHESQFKRAVIAKLMEDVQDFASAADYRALREIGFATKKPGDRWHNLTLDGRTAVTNLERKLCRQFGIHLLLEGPAVPYGVIFRCPCGWRTKIDKNQFTNRNALSQFGRHVATANGMSGIITALKPVGMEG